MSQFEDVLNQPGLIENLHKLVDPSLGDNYSFDAVCKVNSGLTNASIFDSLAQNSSNKVVMSVFWYMQMVRLARACTQENPQLRPSMRSIVVALMTLSSSTEDWDVGSLYENKALITLMSGR